MTSQQNLPPGMWKRGRVYYARFRAGGREIRRKLSTQLDVVRQVLNELRARADKADFGLVDNGCAWAELKKEFLGWARQAVRGHRKYEQDLAKFEQFFSISNVEQITPQLVVGFRSCASTKESRRGP